MRAALLAPHPRPPSHPFFTLPLPRFTLFSGQVSAKSGDNVEQAFLTVVKAAAKRVKDDEPAIPETIKLDTSRSTEKAGGCAC